MRRIKHSFTRVLTLLLAALLLSASCSGCMKSLELNERILIQAIGIDADGDAYKFTLQAFMSESGSGDTGFDPSQSNTRIITVYGRTISEALSNVALLQGKEAFYGQNKYIAIGRGVAGDDIMRVLSFFNSNNQSRAGTDVVMADGEAAELVGLPLAGSISAALSVRRMLEHDTVYGKLRRSTLMDITNADKNGLIGVSLPILAPIPGESDSDNTIYCRGTALFRDGKFTGELNTYQTRGLMWVTENIDSSIVAFIDNDNIDLAAVKVKRVSAKLDAVIVEGIPHFRITLEATGSLTELLLKSDKPASTDDVASIERYVGEYIAREIENAYGVIVRQNGCDLYRLAEWLKKHHSGYWKEHSEYWADIMPQTTLTADVDLTINRFDLKN